MPKSGNTVAVDGLGLPLWLVLELTYRCPLHCSWCNNPLDFEFTKWDPTAKTDMQALEDVFDTNHNGMLDPGDADWGMFGVLVTNANGTTQFETSGEVSCIGNSTRPPTWGSLTAAAARNFEVWSRAWARSSSSVRPARPVRAAARRTASRPLG